MPKTKRIEIETWVLWRADKGVWPGITFECPELAYEHLDLELRPKWGAMALNRYVALPATVVVEVPNEES